MLPKGCVVADNYPVINVDKTKDLPTKYAVQEFDIPLDVLEGWKKVYKKDLNVLQTHQKTATVELFSPIYACPISIMDHWWLNTGSYKDPDALAFRVVGLNEHWCYAEGGGVPPVKHYKNLLVHKLDGRILKQKKQSDLLIVKNPDQVIGREYLTADNADGPMLRTYKRIFIRLI